MTDKRFAQRLDPDYPVQTVDGRKARYLGALENGWQVFEVWCTYGTRVSVQEPEVHLYPDKGRVINVPRLPVDVTKPVQTRDGRKAIYRFTSFDRCNHYFEVWCPDHIDGFYILHMQHVNYHITSRPTPDEVINCP